MNAPAASAVPMRMLRADGLQLEPLEPAHADAMYPLLADPALYAFEGEPPASVEALRDRYRRQATRRDAAGDELWLNWMVRLDGAVPGHQGELAGYVQATVDRLDRPGRRAWIAYEFGRRWWGLGLASRSVRAMIDELRTLYDVTDLQAVLVAANRRSMALLLRLGFEQADADTLARHRLEPGEALMLRPARP